MKTITLMRIRAGVSLFLCLFGSAFPSQAETSAFSLDMRTEADWITGSPPGGTIGVSVNVIEGKPVLRMEYSYPAGKYVEATRAFLLDQKDYGDVVFFWRGTRNGVTFELKFIDSDGTVFGIKYPTRTITPETWSKVTIPWTDLHVLWGGNLKLDHIAQLGFALSGMGGTGVVEITGFHSEPIEGARIDVAVDQVGYHCATRKEFVVRVVGDSAFEAQRLPFSVRDSKSGEVVFSGEAVRQEFEDWPGKFYRGDFSELRREGRYVVEVSSAGNAKPSCSYPFEIGTHVLSARTARLEFSFLQGMHCGEVCHTNTPLRGGYHDTRFDISQRMWAIPHVVLGIKEYAEGGAVQWDENLNGIPDALEELAYGAGFCARFPEPDGTVS